MTYTYSLGAKCISEFVAMTLTIFMGESILANELLPSTKGHGMGLMGVSFGFGLAFGVNIAWFSFISAHINPAMWFFLFLIGKASWQEFLACACADFAGAFLGAVLVAIFFLPHFGFSLPLPSNISEVAIFLEGTVSLDKNAGRIASAFGPASRQKKGETLRQEFNNFFTRPTEEHFLNGSVDLLDDPANKALVDKMKQRTCRRVAHTHVAEAATLQFLTGSTKSVQVGALLHGRDPRLFTSYGKSLPDSRHTVQIGALLHTHDGAMANKTNGEVSKSATGPTEVPEEVGEEVSALDVEASALELEMNGEFANRDAEAPATLEEEAKAEESLEAYRAALQADASAKLSIFATRPAIFNRPYNLLQEAMLTAALVLGAELFNLRREFQTELTGVPMEEGSFFQSLYVAFFISMLILGLGGPTGLAANPARDLGPRLAHQLLPLPGKGSSEWHYGLVVPLFGPLTGSCIAAGLYKGLEALFNMVEIDEEVGAGVEL